MADNEKGGLSSVDPMADFSQKIRQQTLESQQVLDAHRKRLMELVSSRQQMPFDPAMMALSAGLLSPTKTGGFGESLAAGMTNYAAEAEKQFRRQQEEAKLGYELEMAAQEQKRKMMGQQFFGELASRKKTTLSPSSATEAPAVVPSAASSDASSAPSVVRADDSIRSEVAQAPVKEAPPAPSSPSQVLAQVNKNDQQIRNLLGKIQTSGSDAFADISNEEIAMLEMYSPEYAKMINSYRDAVNKGTTLDVSRLNAFVSASKLELDKVQELRNQAELELKQKESKLREREVGTKEMSIERDVPGLGVVKVSKDFLTELENARKKGDFEEVLRVMRANDFEPNFTVGSDGKLRFMTKSEVDLKNKKNEARFTQTPTPQQIPEYGPGKYDITQVDFSDYRAAKAKGPDALQLWFNDTGLFGDVKIPGAKIGTIGKREVKPSDDSTSAGRIESAEDIEARAAAKLERAKEAAKADVEFGNQLMKAGTDAPNLRIIAKDLKSTATNNPKILDIMQDTTITDALARTIQNGLQTPWGSLSIDPKDLYAAIDNFASSKPNITKKDRDAYSLLLRNIAQLTVLERRLSRGEGQISDRETVLFQQVNLLPSDSALAVRLKAELMEERANAVEKIGDAFYQFKKKTGGSYEDFTHSGEYKEIQQGYEKRLDRIRESNAKLLSNAPEPKAATQSQLPESARKQLAEGQVTTFNNGQQWTLRNGKPVRIK